VTTGDLKLVEWMESDEGDDYRAYTFRLLDGSPDDLVIDAPVRLMAELEVGRVYRLTIDIIPAPEGT
jgi:hypothetical protein